MQASDPLYQVSHHYNANANASLISQPPTSNVPASACIWFHILIVILLPGSVHILQAQVRLLLPFSARAVSCSVCAGRMRRIVVWQCASNFLSNDDQSTCW